MKVDVFDIFQENRRLCETASANSFHVQMCDHEKSFRKNEK